MPRLEHRPDGVTRIHFDASILVQDEPRSAVDIRPPNAGEFLDLGDPMTWVIGPDGAATRVVDRAQLRAWAVRLAQGVDMEFVLRRGDLGVGMAIEDAVLGFFTSARTAFAPASAPSQPAPTSPGSPA